MKLYVIHGWTYTVKPWTRTISLLKKAGIDIEMLHVPGLTEPSQKVWTIQDYVDWADKNIPDGAIALGHSNGGRILLNLLGQKPDKLKHLILLDAAGVYEPSSRNSTLRAISKAFAPLKKIPGMRRVVHKLIGASDYGVAPDNMKKTLTNMLDSDRQLDISKVTVPTTILWGEADTVTPVHQAEVMHEKIKGSKLKTYKNWTHAPYICDPDGLSRALASTCKEITGKSNQGSSKEGQK